MEAEKGKEIARIWDSLWKKVKVEEWDKPSETIYQILCKAIIARKDKLMLEAGSGTGRISLKLMRERKATVILLDVSKTAIKMSKEHFKERGQVGFFILGSIFNMPIKTNSIDIVWNAGVLEHFSEHERTLALKEMAKACRNNGLIITINPYSRSLLYRVGKWVAEKRKKWIYGYEKPVNSMTKHAMDNCLWVTEYSADFDTSINFLSSIPYSRYFIPIICKIFNRLPTHIPKYFGYLLISVAIKVK